MNFSELRTAVKELADRAKQGAGEPSFADRSEAHALFVLRSELSSQLSSAKKIKFAEEPDWSTWSAIAGFFDAYYAAIVDLQEKMVSPMAELRLTGI